MSILTASVMMPVTIVTKNKYVNNEEGLIKSSTNTSADTAAINMIAIVINRTAIVRIRITFEDERVLRIQLTHKMFAQHRRRRERGRGRGSPAKVEKLTQREYLRIRIPSPTVAAEELLPQKLEPFVVADDDPFLPIKRALAVAKTKLDEIPKHEFNTLSVGLDLYHGLKIRVRNEFGMLISTNASLKMYEMLVQQGLLACDSGAMPRARVFCDAELPGAFIVAINHYVKTRCPETNLDWIASSYYPASAMSAGDDTILGDKYGIYAGNRDRWIMGPTPNALPKGEPNISGDVTDPDVVSALGDAAHARFNVAPTGASLYTSDAGIDVSTDYNKQEELTALINFGQVLTGILALRVGGNFVTKQYTFISMFNRSLIALLATLFDELYVSKPLTSRPGNSEVYLVGKGFRGISRELANALLDRLAAYRAMPDSTPCDWTPLLDPVVFADVDATLLRVARQLHERQQVAFLEEMANFHRAYRGRFTQLSQTLSNDARRMQDAWLLANPLRRIRDSGQLATSS